MYNVQIVDNEPIIFSSLELQTLPQIAIIDETATACFGCLTKTANALQIQVHRHLQPYWNVSAIVKAYRSINEVPVNAWIVYVRDNVVVDGILERSLKGVHQFKDGLPYAIVKKWEFYPQTLSHEICEMLVNSKLNYYIKSTYNGKIVYYLNEVAGATQDVDFAYTINGVTVTDFYTRSYYDLTWKPNTRYSFTGVIIRPKDILSGGYTSFVDDLGQWWQVFGVGGRERLIKLGESFGENYQNVGLVALVILLIIYFYQRKNE